MLSTEHSPKFLHQIQQLRITASKRTEGDHQPILTSTAAHDVLVPFFREHIDTFEAFRILLFNHGRVPIAVYCVGRGGVTGCTVDTRMIFAAALTTLSTGMILCHNHTSGNTKPSAADIACTDRLVRVGDLHEIEVIDHIILGRNSYFSFADNNMI